MVQMQIGDWWFYHDAGTYSESYNDLFAPIVMAFQEQQSMISEDKVKVKALEEKNKQLECRLKAIEE